MPPCDRFKTLCNLQFRPAIRNSRLSQLARMSFLFTVQDYSERFNTALCAVPATLMWAASRNTSRWTLSYVSR